MIQVPADFSLIQFDVCGSTNDKALAAKKDKVTVVAGYQTKGKGRRGRVWQGERGNLFTSTLFLLDSLDDIGVYSLAGAVSMGEAIKVLSPDLPIAYKWPNDILLGGAKTAGVLLEIAENPLRVVIGVGVNVISFPQGELNYEATCLHQHKAFNIDCQGLLSAYLSFLDFHIKLIKSGEKDKIIKKWLADSYSYDKAIKIKLAKGEIVGIFRGLDSSGNLILSCFNEGTDTITTIPAGEILF